MIINFEFQQNSWLDSDVLTSGYSQVSLSWHLMLMSSMLDKKKKKKKKKIRENSDLPSGMLFYC